LTRTHFDQSPAAKANVNTLKAQRNRHAAAADHQARKQCEDGKQAHRQKVEPPSGASLTKPVCGRVLSFALLTTAEARLTLGPA
jgi:hypothetical protein